MKKGVLILTVILSLVLVAGCVGGNSEQVGPGADSDTGSDADTDAGTDTDTNTSDEDTDASEGNGDLVNMPEPYTDAVVTFVIDGERRGRLAVEIPDTREEIERGLMGRESLPNGTGMLFVYPDTLIGQRRFWMKNTLVPLDIIFVDADGRVVNIEHASPGFEGERECSNPDYYCSDGPAKYVVEAERGYANETGLSPGDRLIVRPLR